MISSLFDCDSEIRPILNINAEEKKKFGHTLIGCYLVTVLHMFIANELKLVSSQTSDIFAPLDSLCLRISVYFRSMGLVKQKSYSVPGEKSCTLFSAEKPCSVFYRLKMWS